MHAVRRKLGRVRAAWTRFPGTGRIGRELALALLGITLLLPGACTTENKDAVVEMKGWDLTLPEAAQEYERLAGPGSFATTTAKDREGFVRTLADKEMLLRLARKSHSKLDERQSHILHLKYEDALLRDFASYRRTAFKPGGAKADTLREVLSQEASVIGSIFPTLTSAQKARAEFETGASFADVSTLYGIGKQPGHENEPNPNILKEMKIRVDSRAMYPPFVIEVLMKKVQAGQLTQPISVQGGFVLFEVKELHRLPEASQPGFYENVRPLIENMSAAEGEQKWNDSLKTAVGFKLNKETYPIVRKRAVAFYDSLDALRTSGVRVDYDLLKPPSLYSLTPEERRAVLFEMRGKPYTVEEFFKGLDDTDKNVWPFGDSLKMMTRMEERINRLLMQTEAENLGLHKKPEFLQKMKILEEERFLTQYHDGLEVAEPTDAEIEAEYNRMPGGGFMSAERISLSGLMYPLSLKARAEALLSKLQAADPEEFTTLARAEHEADTSIVYVPPTRMLEVGRPTPISEWGPLLDVATLLQAGETSTLMPGSGTMNIVRVVERKPAGAMPLDEARPRMVDKVKVAKRDQMVEDALKAEREKAQVKVYAERLAEGAAPDSTSQTSGPGVPGAPAGAPGGKAKPVTIQ